jgi:UDPglucose--hexose-1-phosphate uridylyltransferase
MAEFRKDLLTDRWVLIAEHRAARPDEFRDKAVRRIVAPCPFCAGHEDQTPSAVATYGENAWPDGGEPWQVRVVPNKYPAVQSDGHVTGITAGAQSARGRHEVIIESPRHVVTLSELTDVQVELTFLAYQDRLRCYRDETDLAYALVFKNARAEGGASLEHAHSQLIATPMVPCEVAQELAGAERFQQSRGECPFCAMLHGEMASGQRLVAATEHFVAVCPFASRFPYEVWVLPRVHGDRFEEDPHSAELARLVRDIVRRIESLLPGTAYNYWIHTAPLKRTSQSVFHWHVEIITRMSRMAGFELGAGYFINPVAPEQAANRLRSV